MQKIIGIILGLLCVAAANQPHPAICNLDDRIAVSNEEISKNFQPIPYNALIEMKTYDEFIKNFAEITLFKDMNGDILTLYLCCEGGGLSILFNKNNISDFFLDRFIGLGAGEWVIKDRKASRKFFDRKIYFAKTKPVNSKYFHTKKGIKLGMPSSEVAKVYGPPRSKKMVKKNPLVIRYIWENWGKLEMEGYREAHVKDGFFFAQIGADTEEIKKLGKYCPELSQGRTIYIDFKKTAESDEAIFIYIDIHDLP